MGFWFTGRRPSKALRRREGCFGEWQGCDGAEQRRGRRRRRLSAAWDQNPHRSDRYEARTADAEKKDAAGVEDVRRQNDAWMVTSGTAEGVCATQKQSIIGFDIGHRQLTLGTVMGYRRCKVLARGPVLTKKFPTFGQGPRPMAHGPRAHGPRAHGPRAHGLRRTAYVPMTMAPMATAPWPLGRCLDQCPYACLFQSPLCVRHGLYSTLRVAYCKEVVEPELRGEHGSRVTL